MSKDSVQLVRIQANDKAPKYSISVTTRPNGSKTYLRRTKVYFDLYGNTSAPDFINDFKSRTNHMRKTRTSIVVDNDYGNTPDDRKIEVTGWVNDLTPAEIALTNLALVKQNPPVFH